MRLRLSFGIKPSNLRDQSALKLSKQHDRISNSRSCRRRRSPHCFGRWSCGLAKRRRIEEGNWRIAIQLGRRTCHLNCQGTDDCMAPGSNDNGRYDLHGLDCACPQEQARLGGAKGDGSLRAGEALNPFAKTAQKHVCLRGRFNESMGRRLNHSGPKNKEKVCSENAAFFRSLCP